jgi:outer membrane lipoprotein-sorting protein
MIVNRLCLLAICLFPGMFIQAQTIDAVKANYDKKTFSFKFELSTYWSVREKTDKKTGLLIVTPDNKFNVTLGDETYISNGDTLWSYNKKVGQVTIQNVKKMDLSSLPSGILTQFLYKYTFVPQVINSSTLYEWTAENGTASRFTNLKLWANNKNIITKIETTDNNSNVNTYIFSSIVFNQKVSSKMFVFQIPKNVQVLDNYE